MVVVPKGLRKLGYRDARNSGSVAPAGRLSKFVAIKDPHIDGVRAIVKDKTTTFPEAKKAEKALEEAGC
ncbi:hypothetical protein HOY80DRAFT_1116761 [Tuber brumale]|nr:hypothetical protein HOY80DRAFT_1116761 [Tuber brumale]